MRRGQERYLHHLVGCLPAATLIVRDGRIEASNQRAAELLGVAHRAGLVGQRADSVISGIEEATRYVLATTRSSTSSSAART
jgi:PAS domain-containing protein